MPPSRIAIALLTFTAETLLKTSLIVMNYAILSLVFGSMG